MTTLLLEGGCQGRTYQKIVLGKILAMKQGSLACLFEIILAILGVSAVFAISVLLAKTKRFRRTAERITLL
jgi:hypothetical protein